MNFQDLIVWLVSRVLTAIPLGNCCPAVSDQAVAIAHTACLAAWQSSVAKCTAKGSHVLLSQVVQQSVNDLDLVNLNVGGHAIATVVVTKSPAVVAESTEEQLRRTQRGCDVYSTNGVHGALMLGIASCTHALTGPSRTREDPSFVSQGSHTNMNQLLQGTPRFLAGPSHMVASCGMSSRVPLPSV